VTAVDPKPSLVNVGFAVFQSRELLR